MDREEVRGRGRKAGIGKWKGWKWLRKKVRYSEGKRWKGRDDMQEAGEKPDWKEEWE